LLVDEDFVLITAINEIQLTRPRIEGGLSGEIAAKRYDAPIADRCAKGVL
jgi:hypothetical protein